jgi:hypothetical protein
MIKIHHATANRATRLGFDLDTNEDGTVSAIRHEDDARSVGTYTDPKALVDALMNGQVEFADPQTDEEIEEETLENFKGLRSGVMVLVYHVRYTQNGGGCGDTLDQALRDLLLTEEGTNLDLLRTIAECNGVWVQKWAALNPGMQRMNLANKLRARLRNDVTLVVNLGEEGTGRFDVEYAPSKKTLRAMRKG